MNNYQTKYRDAVEREVREAMYHATVSLYTGNMTAPKALFMKLHSDLSYDEIFKDHQRKVLEEKAGFIFDIAEHARNYDISLHYMVQQYLCGLAPKGDMKWSENGNVEYLLVMLKNLRNDVSHQPINTQELISSDYSKQINLLNQRCQDARTAVNNLVKQRRPEKINEDQMIYDLHCSSRFNLPAEGSNSKNKINLADNLQEENDDGWKNVLVAGGIVAGIAALGAIGGAMYESSKEEERKKRASNPKQNSSNQTHTTKDENCIVM